MRRLGTLADLDGEIDRCLQVDPDNMFSWLPLMYWRTMLNGKGKNGLLENTRYPTIHPTGVRDYVEEMSK